MKNENRKNSILHISRTMDIGGAERIVYQLSSDLKMSLTVFMSHLRVGFGRANWLLKGIQHHKILDIDSKNPVTVLKLLFSIHQIIKQKGITIVHTHHRMAAFYIRLLNLFIQNWYTFIQPTMSFKDKLPLYGFALKMLKVWQWEKQ